MQSRPNIETQIPAPGRGRRWWLGLGLLLTGLNWLLPAMAQSNSVAAYTWSTFAGSTDTGIADGVGPNAQFYTPRGAAADTNGNVYVADSRNNTIRKITPAGQVSTIAGYPQVPGSSDGVNSAARFNLPFGVASDKAGNLYVTDSGNGTIRKISPVGTNWVVTTIAGSPGIFGTADGIGPNASFGSTNSGTTSWIAADNASNLFLADTFNRTIRKISLSSTNWVVTTIAGSPGIINTASDGIGTNALFVGPDGMAADNSGNVYVVDGNTIRKIVRSGTNWVVTTIAGHPGQGYYGYVDGTNSSARFNSPLGLALDASGNLYASENDEIRKISPIGTNWVVSTFAGQYGVPGYADGTGTNAFFLQPWGLAVDLSGNICVADSSAEEVRKITSAGLVTTIAGSPQTRGSVDSLGANARFNLPSGVAVDSAGYIYVGDSANLTIRKISPLGLVSTFAGQAGISGSADGVGQNARFAGGQDGLGFGVAVDGAGNVYVADSNNQTIRKITPPGVVTTLAGSVTNSGSADGTNGAARFNSPFAVAVGTNGNVYVADSGNNSIRKLTPSGTNWVVTTIAGGFNGPWGVAADNAGNVYVADTENFVIHEISPAGTNWLVTTLAGQSGVYGSSDGIGTNAQFAFPVGISADQAGNLYVSDADQTIRKLTPINGNWTVTTIGGLSGVYGSRDGPGLVSRFFYPSGVAVDGAGNVYVADSQNNTIRKGSFTAFNSASLSVNAVSGTGSLKVTLLPAAANGQWRFGWEQNWRANGTTASGLVAGNYPVQFKSVPGWLVVQTTTNFTVAVTNGGTTFLTNQYYPTLAIADTNSSGSLTIKLANSPAQPPPGAGWHFLGDNGYYPSGYSTNLVAGIYQIGYAPVNGYSTPPNIAVTISAGLPTLLTENYLLADAAPAGVNFPFPVPTNQIGDVANYPFGFNGQLQSDVGYGSGVAVAPKVVLSAAHLVFDDRTLNYVSQTYWYFQQETNVTAVQLPQVARGWLVLGGYATQRTNDLNGLGGQTYGPDQSSPQSRNADVAALYFTAPVAGGGYGGYLPSDATPNPWLTGNSLKMVVGYPVDGSLFGNASIMPGVMYQTTPQPYALSADSQPQVYTAPWVLGYPGNSGGPVYVQLNDYYYPAGVFLGIINNGSYQSVVRAINSEVVGLITNAEALADFGTNYSGGGVITIIPSQAVSASNPGYLQFQLGPPGAVTAGAGWKLSGDAAYSGATNYTRAVLTTNAFTVVFKTIAGWNIPASQNVTVQPGNIVTYNALYTVASPLQIMSPQVAGGSFNLSFSSVSGQSYTLYYNDNLGTTNWQFYTNVNGTGGTLQLSVPMTNSVRRFFRLGQP